MKKQLLTMMIVIMSLVLPLQSMEKDEPIKVGPIEKLPPELQAKIMLKAATGDTITEALRNVYQLVRTSRQLQEMWNSVFFQKKLFNKLYATFLKPMENKENVSQMIDGLALLVLALPHSNGSAILHELMKKDANNEAIFTTKAKAQLTDYFFDLVAKRAFNAMRYLIAMKNIEINAIDEHLFSYTPLMWAASMGHLAMVKYLVQNGADMSLVDEHGETALDLAKESGHDEVVEYLERVMKKA